MGRPAKAVRTECNFCGKRKEDVVRLIISNDTGICDECVMRCLKLITVDKNEKAKKNVNLTKHTNPEKIKAHLDQYVIGQDHAKIALAVGVANHYKRLFFKTDVEVDKSNIIILGPTGSGKTMLARTIARFLNVPFIIADATSLTEAGYVGDDVESIIQRLLAAAEGDVDLCEQGIVFIDEVDKIAKKSENQSITRDVSGEGVQQALLKMVEGSVCRIPTQGSRKHPMAQMVEIDTSNILFIAGGAFEGLNEIINKRVNETIIGFGGKVVSKKLMKLTSVAPEDLMKFGLIPEFVGRFPITVTTDALSKEELVQILVDVKHNLVEQFRFYFGVDDVELEFTPDAITAIVEDTQKLKVGARGLKTTIERNLQKHLFKLPQYKKQKVKKVICTAETFRNVDNEVQLIGQPNE